MGDAVGRGGDAGSIREAGDGAERLRGLSVSDDGAVGSVYTREILVFTVACFEDAFLSGVGSIVGTAHTIVDVLAVVTAVWPRGVADFHTEASTAGEPDRA